MIQPYFTSQTCIKETNHKAATRGNSKLEHVSWDRGTSGTLVNTGLLNMQFNIWNAGLHDHKPIEIPTCIKTSLVLWGRGERKHVLMFSCSLQIEETSLTKDRNHLEDREILGWGILFESWQLKTVLPLSKMRISSKPWITGHSSKTPGTAWKLIVMVRLKRKNRRK